jgi:hypothetical protein
MIVGFGVAVAMVNSHFDIIHKQIGLGVVVVGALQVRGPRVQAVPRKRL